MADNLSEKYSDLFQQSIENAQDEIYWITSEGKIVYANKSACKNNHYSLSDLQNMFYHQIDAHANKISWNSLKQVLKINHSFRYESIFINKYNEEIPMEVSAIIIKNDTEDYFSLICHNIAKRKKAEQKLKSNEEKFRLFTEINRDTIIQFDRNNIIKYSSPVALKMFGYSNNEMEKHSVYNFIFNDDKELIKSALQSIYNGDEMRSLEIQMRKKNGDYLDVELTILPFIKSNEIIGIHMIIHDNSDKIKREADLDQAFLKYENIIMESEVLNVNLEKEIAERKKIEKELKKARAEAEYANKAKSEFLANMSHEIRTPLNAVLGFAEILKEKLAGNGQFTEYLDGINTGGNSLLSLINDILDLSKIDAGRMEIQKEPLSLSDVLEEVNQIFKKKIENKGLKLIINIDENIPELLEMDHTRLRQILFNLVGNAVKFTSVGTITLSAKLTNKISQNTANIEIYVADTGLGIPRKQQRIIFSPFKQQEGQSTRQYGGTGLGLTITKRLIEMMQGEISVESKIGKGSKFLVKLNNVVISDQLKQEKQLNPNYNFDYIFTSSKILLAEDNDLNRKVFKGFLEKYDIEVVEAVNGQIALDILKNMKPDVIFLDLRMPVMGGIETAQKIRNSINLKFIPMVAISASMIQNYAHNEIKLFDDILNKPVTKKDLIRKLSKYIAHETVNKETENSIKKEEQKQIDLNVSKLSKEQVNYLKNIFEAKISGFLNNIKDYVDIEDTKELAQILIKTGETIQYKNFNNIGKDLLNLSNLFKINQIEKLILRLEVFFNELIKI